MDRDDVALRCYLAELTGSHANPAFDSDPKEWLYGAIASTAYKAADAFMDHAERIDARPVKSGPSAPVAPKSEEAKYEPRVGDVVRFLVFANQTRDGVVTGADSNVVSIRPFGDPLTDSTWGRYFKDVTYLRPATPSEREAAGITTNASAS